MKSFAIRIALLTAYILFHLFILREIRTALFQVQLNESLISKVEQSEELSFYKLDTRLVYFEYHAQDSDFEKIWRYKVPFGSYFFIAVCGLIAIGASRKYFTAIAAVHGLVLAITGLIFAVDVSTNYWLLAVCDFLSRYLVPLCSLGIIPIAILEKRKRS